MAITAWAAKVRTSSIWRSLNGSMRWRESPKAPIASPSRRSGTPRIVLMKPLCAACRATCSLSVPISDICTGRRSARARPMAVPRPGAWTPNRSAPPSRATLRRPRRFDNRHRPEVRDGPHPPDTAPRLFHHRLEHRLQLAGRRTDDAKHFCRRRLLLQRLVQLARFFDRVAPAGRPSGTVASGTGLATTGRLRPAALRRRKFAALPLVLPVRFTAPPPAAPKTVETSLSHDGSTRGGFETRRREA